MCTLFPAIYPPCQRAQNVHLYCVTFYPPLPISDFVSARSSAAHKQEPGRKSCRVILGRAATGAGGKQSSKCAWEMEMRFGSSGLCFAAQKGYLKGSSFLYSESWEITAMFPDWNLSMFSCLSIQETRSLLPLRTSQCRSLSIWCD